MRKLTIWWLLALTCISLAGCNTVRGMGEDVQDAGAAIQRATK